MILDRAEGSANLTATGGRCASGATSKPAGATPAWPGELFTQALELLEAEGDLDELRCCEHQMRRLGQTGPAR